MSMSGKEMKQSKKPNRTPTVRVDHERFNYHFKDESKVYSQGTVAWLLDIRKLLIEEFGRDISPAEFEKGLSEYLYFTEKEKNLNIVEMKEEIIYD
jgi:hypothetical protein